ncbi:MAG: sulfatase-like hydrolase/transferase, partial [Flavobacteriales bacterium]|nr:sulfatase-like hydrolase/transferase [Flavobacteriales bacterium]
FITSRYQQRFGHEANVPPPGLGMALDEFTAGQAFKSVGYNTYLIGKWHLGDTEDQYPTNRGFDDFYGLREGSRNYFYNPEHKHDEPGNAHNIEHNGKQIAFKGFLTDRMTDQAIRMAESSRNVPFFMFLSYTAPHAPLQAKPEDLEKANGNPYVALVQNMDKNIGRLLNHLEQIGKRDNTIIWFLSDNGGTVNQACNIPLNGKKGIKFEGGQRIPFILNYPAEVQGGRVFEGTVSSMS